MLVINRKLDQQIQIGDDITITVVRIRGRQDVRIGIEAPDDLTIRRVELLKNGKEKGTDA